MKFLCFVALVCAASLSAAHASPKVILDCENLQDGIDAKICEESIAIKCENSSSQVVSALNSIYSFRKVKILAVIRMEESRYRVEFQFEDNINKRPQVNYVNVLRAIQQSSCSISTVELGSYGY